MPSAQRTRGSRWSEVQSKPPDQRPMPCQRGLRPKAVVKARQVVPHPTMQTPARGSATRRRHPILRGRWLRVWHAPCHLPLLLTLKRSICNSKVRVLHCSGVLT